MDFSELARSRFSVRQFSEQPVPRETLDKILEAGRLAPTACNLQPQHVYVLQSQAALDAIRAITPCAFNDPVVLLVCGDTKTCWTNPYSGHTSAEVDASIVAAHMMLQAADLALGTTWVGYFDAQKVKEAFSLPDGVEPCCLLPLGFPAKTAAPAELHGQRKPMDETVSFL